MLTLLVDEYQDIGPEEYALIGEVAGHHLLRRDEWEVILPELVFEAGAQAVRADQKGS